MATPEVKESEIKTPEDLIKELEKKSKVILAWKVKDIINKITDHSKDKWQELKEKLNPVDSKAIVELFGNLKSKLIDENLDKTEQKTKETVAKYAKVAAWTAWIWWVFTVSAEALKEEVSGLKDAKWLWFIEKMMSFFEKISDTFDNIIEWVKTWFTSKFPKIASLFWIESKDDWDSKKDKVWSWDDKKDSSKEQNDKNNENNSNFKYQAVTGIFIKMFWGQFSNSREKIDNKETLQTLFVHKQFKNKTVRELKEIYKDYIWKKDKTWIKEKLWVEWIHSTDKEIYFALTVLVASNSYWYKLIDNLYKKKKPEEQNFNDKTIEEVMLWLHRDIHLIQNFDQIGSVDELLSWKTPDIFNLWVVSKDWGLEITWWLKEKAELLNLSKWLIWFAFINSKITLNNFKDVKYLENMNLISEEDKKLLTEKILPFWKNIINTINGSSFNLWLDLSGEFNENKLSLKQILDLYIITWWNTNINEMNTLEKTYLYAKIPWMMENPNLSAQYFANITKEIEKSASVSLIPQEVKESLWNIGNYLAKKTVDQLLDSISWMKWFVTQRPWLAALMLLILVFAPIFTTRQSFYAKVIRR
jgi:hypothetical protein